METESHIKKVSTVVERAKADFLVDLYNRGFHHVVEKIILAFPWKTILVCNCVSKDWSRLVNQFQHSKIPRHLIMLETTKAEEWKNRNCIMKSIVFVTMLPHFVFQCCDIVADSKLIAMHATATHHLRVVIIFNAQTLGGKFINILREAYGT